MGTDPYGNPLPPGHGEEHDEWRTWPDRNLYEVKVWIRVSAPSEDEAEETVGRTLDGLLLSKHVESWDIEGEGSTYEVGKELWQENALRRAYAPCLCSRSIKHPPWLVPYDEIADSFRLALREQTELNERDIDSIVATVTDFVANNYGDD